uniref:Protein kinase domain-containing protein n=1 Tax=Oryzias melastigma TaxID=30732 RepID=A0A3B3BGM3_ORYME
MKLSPKSQRFTFRKFLGEGTFGKVAKCRDLTTNQEVAVKITKPSHRDSGIFELNRFGSPHFYKCISKYSVTFTQV